MFLSEPEPRSRFSHVFFILSCPVLTIAACAPLVSGKSMEGTSAIVM